MTYPTKLTLLLVAALAVFFVACNKTPDTVSQITDPLDVDNTQLNALMASLRYTPQQFTIAAGTKQVIRGQKGTKLTFYPNTFLDDAGNPIVSGTVDVRLTEMYTTGDMIANGATTMGKEGYLESGGQVLIKGTLNGKPVRVAKYGISFANAKENTTMSLFPGNTNNPDSLVMWEDPMTAPGSFATGTMYDSSDPASPALVYNFDSCASFELINCDQFQTSTAPRTKIYVKIDNPMFRYHNTRVFLAFPTINAVGTLNKYETANQWFTVYELYKVPIGMPMNLVILAFRSNKIYYYEQKGLTITANMEIDVSGLTEQTEQYIKDKLKQL
jgi:hypothetical protein